MTGRISRKTIYGVFEYHHHIPKARGVESIWSDIREAQHHALHRSTQVHGTVTVMSWTLDSTCTRETHSAYVGGQQVEQSTLTDL